MKRMMKKIAVKKRVTQTMTLGLAMLLSLALLLTGCGSQNVAVDPAPDAKGGDVAGTNSDDLLHAVVGYWGGTCEAPFYVAYEKGFFKEAGLDVDLLQITSDVAILMANDELDFFGLTPSNFKPMEQGLGLKIIDSMHIGCIQGAASVESGIKSVADLEGKTVAAAVGSIPQIQISSQMVKLGLDPNKVNWVVYPNAQMELALDQGEIDAFAAYDPFPEIAVQNGKVKFYSNTFDQGLKDYLCCFVGMNQKTLERNPEIGERMTKAIAKATKYLEENPYEVAEMAIEKGYIAGTAELNGKLMDDYTWISGDEQLLDDSFNEIWHQIARAGALDDAPADLEGYIADLKARMVDYLGE